MTYKKIKHYLYHRIWKKIGNLKRYVAMIFPNSFYFSQKGFCPCCDSNVTFYSLNSWLRDHFRCSKCDSIPRERALMHIIEKLYPNWKELKIHESSPGNRGASLKLKQYCSNYTASQFYSELRKGSIIGSYQNEDLENQTFSEESFDLVITQDVMEHVYDPKKAFKEIARTLKKGGSHIFTVPLVNKFEKSERWAEKGENGEPIFLKMPEYHGNPVDPKGSPVTMHWGFDIVDYIDNSSGLTSNIEYIDDLSLGIRAEYIEVIVSKKE